VSTPEFGSVPQRRCFVPQVLEFEFYYWGNNSARFVSCFDHKNFKSFGAGVIPSEKESVLNNVFSDSPSL